MTDAERDALIAEFQSTYQRYGTWAFDYEHPGYFVYYGPKLRVYFTPEHSDENFVDIQIFPVNEDGGKPLRVYSEPWVPRTPAGLWEIVKPFLDSPLGSSPERASHMGWRP